MYIRNRTLSLLLGEETKSFGEIYRAGLSYTRFQFDAAGHWIWTIDFVDWFPW